MARRILIVGAASDSGKLLVQRLRSQAQPPQIVVTSRGVPAATLDYLGIDAAARAANEVVALEVNPTMEDGREKLAAALASAPGDGPKFDAVVNLLGAWFARPGRESPRQILLDGVVNVAKVVQPRTAGGPPPRFVVTSSTSVYGDRPGEVLTEQTPLRPDSRTAFSSLQVEVETTLQSMHEKRIIDLVLLRIPHLYGTQKEKTISLYRDGSMIVMGNGKNIMQHLHYHDYVSAMALAADHTKPAGFYNVVDDTVEPYTEYARFITDWCRQQPSRHLSMDEAIASGALAKLLGPAFERQATVQEVFIPLGYDARFDNSKAKQQLGLSLKYPTFRHGLAALMLAMDWRAAGWTDSNVYNDALAEEEAVDGGYANKQETQTASKL
eukprot:gnl/TRDRNA2_/TRDRNA2_159188_c1_seq1.p1 gnl/TRDRNA2_/TRDRNA2_159188_c1~~gnl/TRDRNA2_/TRDRNA2_159188_c1_seq1.p1  ORF type:complete len:383 (+),score=70.83 gnl/TRDRNA2_/TRDRNA2_159188_c1_seq1:68-1216(+)